MLPFWWVDGSEEMGQERPGAMGESFEGKEEDMVTSVGGVLCEDAENAHFILHMLSELDYEMMQMLPAVQSPSPSTRRTTI